MVKKEVCVVGAGIIGLSVATHLLEKYSDRLNVTVIADKFSPNTAASDKTGGLFIPPRTHSPCPDLPTAKRWVAGSLRHFERLVDEAGSERVGIRRAKGYYFPLESQTTIWWSELVPDFQKANDKKAAEVLNHKETTNAYSYTSYVVTGPAYLAWLMHRFRLLGGNVRKQFVTSLSELPHEIVVNCTGLGARELVNDKEVYPSKGHLFLVDAPWVKEWIHHKSAYVFTRTDGIVLGTTVELGKEDFETSEICKQRIMNNCKSMLHSLANADVKKCWVGIRPMRTSGVRLEAESVVNNQQQVVVHCYGHGSFGVTLSWGCAEDVGTIIGEHINQQTGPPLSRL